jgi:O-antigen/teichoic acid export membrane protein
VPGSSLLSDAAISVIGAIVSIGISGLASIVIARQLGVTARGHWAVISSLAVLIATFVGSGLPIAASYGAARVSEQERARFVQAAIAGSVVLSGIAAVVYLLAAALIRPGAPAVAVIIGVTIPAATVCFQVTRELTVTTASLQWYAGAQLAAAAVAFVAVVIIATVAKLTIVAVVLLSTAAQLAGVVVSLAGLRRHRALGTPPLVSGATARDILRPYLSYAIITFATLSLTQVVQRFDTLLVNGYKGPHAAGLYAVAGQVSDLMLVVPAALGLVMFRRGARSSPQHVSDLLRVLRATAAFALVGAIAVAVLANWLVPLVFGTAYRGSVQPLRFLLPGVVAFSLLSVLSNYIAGRGRPRLVLVAWLAGTVVAIGADLVVIPAFGIVGAAIVSSASYLVVTSIHLKVLRSVTSGA